MNKYAKFHKDSPSGKKVKLNLPSVTELSETADFVYNFRNLTQASNFDLRIWPTFLWHFLWNFQRMPLNVFYTMVQKVKNDQKLKSRGPALIISWSDREVQKVPVRSYHPADALFLGLGKQRALVEGQGAGIRMRCHAGWLFAISALGAVSRFLAE